MVPRRIVKVAVTRSILLIRKKLSFETSLNENGSFILEEFLM